MLPRASKYTGASGMAHGVLCQARLVPAEERARGRTQRRGTRNTRGHGDGLGGGRGAAGTRAQQDFTLQAPNTKDYEEIITTKT